MSSFAANILAVFFAALTVVPAVHAQLRGAALDAGVTLAVDVAEPQATVPATVDEKLYRMSQQAGVIFAGQVLAVRPHVDPWWGAGSGWIEIVFRVDQAVRGCSGQSVYTLREWSGLWAGGGQRYTVGRHLLMLLHTPSASGLSSPVDGQEGAIPLIGAGAAPGPLDTSTSTADQAVDLRWVEARLLRPDPSPQVARSLVHEPRYSGKERNGFTARRSIEPQYLRSEDNGAVVQRLAPAAVANPITVPLTSRGITLRGILSMLMTWEAEQTHATR